MKVRVIGTIDEIKEIEKLLRKSEKVVFFHNGEDYNSRCFTNSYDVYPLINKAPRGKISIEDAFRLLLKESFAVRVQYDYRISKAYIKFGISHYDLLCQLIPDWHKLISRLRHIEVPGAYAENKAQ